MPGEQKTDLYCLCWNDARMLPFFFRHYDDIVDQYHVYDNGSTDGSLDLLHEHGKVQVSHFDVDGDSFCAEEVRLGDTIWRGSDADWVIITDIDEHIYHPELTAYLQQCSERGVTAIQSVGYEMISDNFPSYSQRLVDQVPTGTWSVGHDRLCVFNPRAIDATNYGIGRHNAKPTGRVVWPDYPEVLLLHYKQLGVKYPIARSAELLQGLKSGDMEANWGFHYSWSVAEITAKWEELRAMAHPVPGLGTLRHIRPAQYFEADHVVKRSGLFDEHWYLETNPDVKEAGGRGFAHYCHHGWKESRRPNLYFDPEWYCANYPQRCTSDRNPLCSYIEIGEREGDLPSPLFDPGWYKAQNKLDNGDNALSHYLVNRTSGLVSPNPEFDAAAYCAEHPEVLAEGRDPFEDYSKRAD